MNILLTLVIVAVLMVLCGTIIQLVGGRAWLMILYTLGLIALVFGIYLAFASMWREIAIIFIIVGILLEVVAIVMTMK